MRGFGLWCQKPFQVNVADISFNYIVFTDNDILLALYVILSEDEENKVRKAAVYERKIGS